MNRLIRLMTIVMMVVLSTSHLKAQSTTEEILDKFFTSYQASPQAAVDYIFGTNKWMVDRNKDGIASVKTKLASFLELVGEYYGYELITEKSVGESYKLVSYMIKYDRQPLRFTFVFYKPKDTWQVQNFKYDDNIGDELEESGKVYRLKENLR